MSKEIDNLLDNLIKEIDSQDGQPAPKEPKPASAEAQKRAEAIAKDVNQSYRRPPEPVKQSIPAPQINPVVEPEPTSHFTEEPSSDPAIRMHDRLDESTLPAPDAKRRPNQIMDMNGGKKSRSRRKNRTRSMPAPAETPKRKIPHINVPDELPPDVESDYDQNTSAVLRDNSPVKKAAEEDPVRDEFVRSRAEKIREQLKKNTLEETPIIAPPSAEEIDDMLNELEKPEPAQPPLTEEDKGIFAYLHQVLGVEEEEETPAEEPAPAEEEQPAAESRPRWFDDAPAPAMPLHHGHVESADDEDEYDEYDEYDEEDETSGDDSGFGDEDEEAPAPAKFRHLDMEDEEEKKPANPIAAFFKNLFGKRAKEEDEFEDDELDEEDFDGEFEEDYEDEAPAEEDVTEEEPEIEEPVEEEPVEEEPEIEEEPEFEEPVEEEPVIEEPVEEEPEIEEPAEEEPEFEEPAEDEPEFGEFDEDAEDSYEDEEDEVEDDEELLEDEPGHRKRGFFREAFDESAEELADLKSEPVPEPDRETGVKQRFLGRNSYFVAGIIVFLLALVGLVTLISGLVKVTGGFFSGGSLKSQLEKTLYPVAVVDVPAFNEPAELTADGALSAAIVDILMYDDLSGYTETFDMISVPAADVLERGRAMFGVDVQTQLDTLHAAGESFVYDAQTQCYNVPVSPMIFSYSPEVKNIKRSGDTYEVTVVYHSDVADWQENSRNFTEGSSKTMRATIEKKSTGYRIVSLAPVE